MSDTVYLVYHHEGNYDIMLGADYSNDSERIVKCFKNRQDAENYCSQFIHIKDETDEYCVWDYYTIVPMEVE